MNYIEQINLLNRTRRKDSLGPIAIALHIILLDVCNSDDWENPFSLKNDRILSDLDVTFKTLAAARNQLQQSGLIKFKTKNGSAECIYQILSPDECKEIRTFVKIPKVRDEVTTEVGIEVRDEVTAEVGIEVRDEVTAEVGDAYKGILKQKHKQKHILLEKESKGESLENPNACVEKSNTPEKEKCSAQKENTALFRQKLLSSGMDASLVSEWMLIRHKKKAVNTERACDNFLREVEKTGYPPNEVLTLVVKRQWKGLEAQWFLNEIQKGNQNQYNGQVKQYQGAVDRAKGVLANIIANQEH